MKLLVSAWIILGMLWCGVPVVHADEVTLTNGRTLEGIVVAETDEGIRLQVMAGGYLMLDSSEIQHVQVTSRAARDALQARWIARANELQARRQELLAFQDAQRRRGLVRYRGSWITEEELKHIRSEAARARDARQHQQVQQQRPEPAPVRTRTVFRRIFLPFHVTGQRHCSFRGHIADKPFRLARASARPASHASHVCASHGTHHPSVCHRAARRAGGIEPRCLTDPSKHASR